jgi:uncharacterized protein DUF4105
MRRIAAFLGLALVFFSFDARAAQTVDLYTIGPSGEFPSRFGHSLLCIRPADKDTPENGRCYDYGVPDREDIPHVVWAAFRGVPSFVPIAIDEPRVIAVFKGQGRQIEKQRISLAPEEADKLAHSSKTTSARSARTRITRTGRTARRRSAT